MLSLCLLTDGATCVWYAGTQCIVITWPPVLKRSLLVALVLCAASNASSRLPLSGWHARTAAGAHGHATGQHGHAPGAYVARHVRRWQHATATGALLPHEQAFVLF